MKISDERIKELDDLYQKSIISNVTVRECVNLGLQDKHIIGILSNEIEELRERFQNYVLDNPPPTFINGVEWKEVTNEEKGR